MRSTADHGASALRILLLVGGAASLALILWVSLRQPSRETRALQRADRAAETAKAARAAFAAGDIPAARARADAARELDPGNAEANRVLAELLFEAAPRKAIVYTRQLTELGVATPQDWARHAALCRRLGLHEEAAAATRLAGDAGRPRAEDAQRKAMAETARSLHETHPTDPQLALMHARLLLTREPEAAAELLETLANGSAPAADQALRILAGARSLPDRTRLDAAARLTAKPDARLADHLLAASTQIEITPDRRHALVAQTLHGRVPDKPAKEWSEREREDVAALIAWLSTVGLPTKGTELVREPDAATHPALASALAEALIAAGKPREARAMIDQARSVLPDLQSAKLLAAAATAAGDTEGATSHWNSAFRGLRGTRDAEAITALLQMAGGNASNDAELIAQYLQAMQARGNTYGLMELSRELSEAYADSPDFRNNLYYFRLLLEDPLRPTIAELEQLAKAHPSRETYLTTLALGLLKEGQTDKATAAVAPFLDRWSALADGDKAIVAAVLARNGDRVTAVQLRSQIVRERLLPEEAKLLDEEVGRYLADEAAFARRIAELRERRETRALLAVLRSRAALNPKLPVARRDYAYLRTLATNELAGVIRDLRDLSRESPTDESTRILLAFALLRNGETAAAAEELEPVAWNKDRPPEEQMVFAAVLAAKAADRLEEEERFLRTWVLDPPASSPVPAPSGG